MAMMKKQKRERPVIEKDQRNSQSPMRRGGEGSLEASPDEVLRTEG